MLADCTAGSLNGERSKALSFQVTWYHYT